LINPNAPSRRAIIFGDLIGRLGRLDMLAV
jgi:hypothetical protein